MIEFTSMSNIFHLRILIDKIQKSDVQKLASIVKQKLLHPMIIIIDYKNNSNIIDKSIKLYSEVRKYYIFFNTISSF